MINISLCLKILEEMGNQDHDPIRGKRNMRSTNQEVLHIHREILEENPREIKERNKEFFVFKLILKNYFFF